MPDDVTKGWMVVAQVNDNPLKVFGPVFKDESSAVEEGRAVRDKLDEGSDASFAVYVIPATQIG